MTTDGLGAGRHDAVSWGRTASSRGLPGVQPQSWHQGLVARWWSLFRVLGPEVAYFRQFVEEGQPALDVACGAGRLLAPYVEAGLDVDGCDVSADMLAWCAQAAMAVGAGIYAVDMSTNEGGATNNQQTALLLKSFAEKSGGRFIATPGGPALRDAFASIARELGHQYTIAFRPPNQAHDGRWRSLEVKLSRPELTVRTRKGYRAPKR